MPNLGPNSPAGPSRADAIRDSRARQSIGGRGGAALRREANASSGPRDGMRPNARHKARLQDALAAGEREYIAAGLAELLTFAHYGTPETR